MMNVLIPSAGFGKRFSNNGYQDPKPFIKVKDKYIIEYAIASLNIPGKYFIITSKLNQKYLDILSYIYDKYNIDGQTINLDITTSGATETCMMARPYIRQNSPLLISMCDQYTPWNSNKFISFVSSGKYDAVVTTYDHCDVVPGSTSKYSFIKVDTNNLAVEFAEKIAISNHALNGIHYWHTSDLFFESAKSLLNSDINFNGEKYLSLTFDFLIKQNKKITYYKMLPHEFVSLGSPSEIEMNINKLC